MKKRRGSRREREEEGGEAEGDKRMEGEEGEEEVIRKDILGVSRIL